MRPTYNKGFTHILLIVFAVLVLGAIGFLVWEFSGDEEEDGGDFDIASASFELPADCDGKYFDSHTHLDDSDFPADLVQRMKEHDVSCAVIFVQMNPDDYEEDLELFYEDLASAPNVFIPFLDVVRDRSTRISREYLERIGEQLNGQYKGFGEFALYRDELRGTDLTQDPWNTLFEFAGEKGKFVMIHISPGPADLAGLKSAMASYPNTKFLVHGFELDPEGYADLLSSYPNFYFTLDTATLLKAFELGPGVHLMYPFPEGDRSQFLADYPKYKIEFLETAKSEWAKVILTAPDRVMWGTDASFEWHADRTVYEKLIEFSGDFASSLPGDVRDKYLHKNAQLLFN